MTNDLLTKGNLTSFATWAAIVLSFIFAYFGIQIDQGVLVAFICMVVTLGIALYSSRHPNTLGGFFGNDQQVVNVEVDAEEVLRRIQEFMDAVEQSNNLDEEVVEQPNDSDEEVVDENELQ